MAKLLVQCVVLALLGRAVAEGIQVPLLTSSVVYGEKLALSDFLPSEAPASLRTEAAQVALGPTPGPGGVRVLDRREVEPRLRPELLRRLRVPEKLIARRPGYAVDPERLRAALQEALLAHGASVPVSKVELGVRPLADTPDPQFRILEVSSDPLRRRWNVRVAIADAPQANPFLVSLPASEPLAAWRASEAARPAPARPRLRAGERALLLIDDAGFRASVPVVCLENGVPGSEIRVRDQINGKIHRARVSEEGGFSPTSPTPGAPGTPLHWLGEEQ
jgi:hypothetical protein